MLPSLERKDLMKHISGLRSRQQDADIAVKQLLPYLHKQFNTDKQKTDQFKSIMHQLWSIFCLRTPRIDRRILENSQNGSLSTGFSVLMSAQDT